MDYLEDKMMLKPGVGYRVMGCGAPDTELPNSRFSCLRPLRAIPYRDLCNRNIWTTPHCAKCGHFITLLWIIEESQSELVNWTLSLRNETMDELFATDNQTDELTENRVTVDVFKMIAMMALSPIDLGDILSCTIEADDAINTWSRDGLCRLNEFDQFFGLVHVVLPDCVFRQKRFPTP